MFKCICHCSRLIRTFPSGYRWLKAWPAGPVRANKLKLRWFSAALGRAFKRAWCFALAGTKIRPLRGCSWSFTQQSRDCLTHIVRVFMRWERGWRTRGGDGWLIIIRVHLVFGLRISRFENIQTPKCQNLDYHFSILMWQYSLRLLHPSILKSVRRPSSSSFSLSCFLCLDCWNLLMTSSLFSLFTIIFSIANLYFNVKHAAKIQTYLESTKLLQIFFLINN